MGGSGPTFACDKSACNPSFRSALSNAFAAGNTVWSGAAGLTNIKIPWPGAHRYSGGVGGHLSNPDFQPAELIAFERSPAWRIDW